MLTGACEYIDEVRVMEVVNYATYAQPTVLFDTMGFGKALDSKPLLLLPGVLSMAWGGVVKVLAAGLGVEIDELREVHERQPAPRDDRPRLRRGRRGHDRGDALRGARRRRTARSASSFEHVTRLADDLCPDWPQPIGHSGYRVIVTGNPTYTCDVQMMGDDGDHNTGGLVGTAARLTNAIPAVCAAPPRIAVSVLDLPLIPGAALHAPQHSSRPVASASIVTVTLLGGSRPTARCRWCGRPFEPTRRRRPPPPVLQTLLPPTRLRIPPPGRRAGPRRSTS